MTTDGNRRSLIVKNVTKAEFCNYSVSAGNEKKEAKLTLKSPWVEKMANIEGFIENIAVFQCKVQPSTHVVWYAGNKAICRKNFRYSGSNLPRRVT